MHNLLIADFFKNETCTRKIGKTPRSRPRESDRSPTNPKNVLQKGPKRFEIAPFANFLRSAYAHRSKQSKILP
jgi:hypothetical protein